MFYNSDRPGQKVQENNILSHIAPAPKSPLYTKQWDFKLPRTFSESLKASGRPAAHEDYILSHDALVGRFDPAEEWRWRDRHNYYLNCLLDVDRNIETVLDELETLDLDSNTIIILTADHGDLDGAHRLHSKGATSYREQNNVPLIISHPAFPGGTRCTAVTSHIDIAPTLIHLTNAPAEKKTEITKNLVGKDFSGLLKNPQSSVRDAQLFCYNMFAYIDGPFLLQAAEYLLQGGKEKLQQMGIKPDLTKRGAIRSVFDGRYQFSRYFSPKQHNMPKTIEQLLKFNDVELFDLQEDPEETNNLALNAKQNGELLMAMNARLTKLIEDEVGEDVGQMLPGGVDGGWVVTPAARDL
jgi:arylsulfatase